jgi:hypothetical protein
MRPALIKHILTNYYSFLSPGIHNGGSTKTQPRPMSHRITRFAPACAALAFLGGCAVYPDAGPGYDGGYYGYGDGPAVVQPEVSIGIGGSYGPSYYDQRRGYGPGYHGQPHWDAHQRPDYGAHPRPGEGGPHNPPPQGSTPGSTPGSASGGPAHGGAPGGRPGGPPPPQAGNDGGQHRGGNGGGNVGGNGGGNGGGSRGGNNRAAGYGNGQHSNSH